MLNISSIFPIDWSSFIPDMIISFVTLLIPLIAQYLITIKPLKKENSDLQKKLKSYSTDIIDNYLNQLDNESARLGKRLIEIENEFQNFLDAQTGHRDEFEYIEFVNNKSSYEEDIDHLNNEIINIQLRKLEFIKKNRDIF